MYRMMEMNLKRPKTVMRELKSRIKLRRKVILCILGSLVIMAMALGIVVSNKNINEHSLASFAPLVASITTPDVTSNQEMATAEVVGLDTSIYVEDERAFILDEYFNANGSPLYGTGKYFVAACDKYGAPRDCITAAAIARAETDLCKYHNSATYFNCWGYGGGGSDRIYFQSFEQSIDTVTKSLAQGYGYEYMVDPTLMERRFCGIEPGCTGWGNRVKYHMNQISEFAKQIGFSKSLLEYR